MSAEAAQQLWCQWPLADRLALVTRWLARQDLQLRTGLSLLPEQAASATHRTTTHLPDGRRQTSGYGPLGVVQLQACAAFSDEALLVNLIWCCVLGNAVLVKPKSAATTDAIKSLQEHLQRADAVLAELVSIIEGVVEQQSISRSLKAESLHVVVAPSADVPLLIKDALHASRAYGVVLWVNHALHHEVQRRLPKAQILDAATNSIGIIQAGDLLLASCGAVFEQLQCIQVREQQRTALYSGDWAEVELACEASSNRGVRFAVNSVDAAPLSLFEAQTLYQRSSLTVISNVSS